MHDPNEKGIWSALERLKNEVNGKIGKSRVIAMHYIKGWKLDEMRKMVEAIFHSA